MEVTMAEELVLDIKDLVVRYDTDAGSELHPIC